MKEEQKRKRKEENKEEKKGKKKEFVKIRNFFGVVGVECRRNVGK